MADSQVEAMRKEFARIMLNMAQESAARVLAAERRAAALAAGLEAAKEDGVAALLRLKAIMEARVKEVELESSVHVKRIKELVEQLHGAQNTMASLKVELHQANDELEQTRRTLAEARINGLPTYKEADSNKDTSPRSKIHQQGGSILLKNKKNAEDCDDACLVPIAAKENGAVEKLDINRCSPDLPSFMERNKKPKFNHNGCTQRIHALKQQAQGTDASVKQNQKQATVLNSCSKTRRNNDAKNPCHTRSIMEEILQTKFLGKYKRKRDRRSKPSCKFDNSTSEHGEAEDKLSDTSEGNGCLLLLQALEQELSPPKISAGHAKEALSDMNKDLKIGRRDAGLNQGIAFPELLDVLAMNNMQVKKRKRTKTIRVLEDEFSDSKSVPRSANTLLRTTIDKSMSDNELISEMTENCSDTPAKDNGPSLKYANENFMHRTTADNGQFYPEKSCAVILVSTKSEAVDYGNLVVDQLQQRTPNTNTTSRKEVSEEGSCSLASHKAGASTVISLDKEEKLKASSGLPMQALDKTDASIGISLNKEEHAKTASGASMQTEGARHIKYTFNRRKRKCVSIYSTPQCAVPEKSSDLGSPPNKQNPHLDPVMQNHPMGSPQGNNNLVHVAQQLILLSERK
ncbi:hypothetical protein PAHAL_1G283000 [Panicum hallii]|uniref:Uncharacterized protein n=1 Tax=Panicum hallii TaxID=206008 RepID=A0A2S3GQN0_9POAL|nr:uncharacterized protein LOC112899280 [Panicum hallii]PAN06715.1 hypothetical protein PAHAL_1G283000 [Panicum hallii]